MIRPANTNDLDELQRIFAAARRYMAASGNPNQWAEGYPSDELLLREIRSHHCYVMADNDRPYAAFCFIFGADPTYAEIDGAWLNDEPYATIHRIASDGTHPGILHVAVEWGSQITGNIRIDTHKNNAPMLSALAREGFLHCGTIRCWNGSPREAFQKVCEEE